MARGEFVTDRPNDAIHTPDPWRPYAHYIAVLADGVARAVADLGLQPPTRVLDFGCADRPYWGLFDDEIEIVGADLPGNPHATIDIADDGSVPVPDQSFDVVLSTQVLEHVEDPGLYLSECRRVVRPGGRLLLTTHGFFQFHPDPVDYWRWTSQGLQKVVEDNGFKVIRTEGIFGFGAVGLQFCANAFIPKLPNRLRPLACRVTHTLIRAVDARQSRATKQHNASVYVLTATRLD